MTRPQRAAYAFPPSYDSDPKVWVQIERDALPFVLGATLGLMKRGAWQSENDWQSGYQMALRTQESLMSVSRAHTTNILLDEQATPPATPATGQLVIYASSGSILRTIRPGGASGQIAELDRAQTWTSKQTIAGVDNTAPLLRVTSDAAVSSDLDGSLSQVRVESSGNTGVDLHAANNTASTGTIVYVTRSRGTLAAPTDVGSNERLGELRFRGRYAGVNVTGARVVVTTGAAPSGDYLPTDMLFLLGGVARAATVVARFRHTGAFWLSPVSETDFDGLGDFVARGRVKGSAYWVGSNQVVGSRGAAVADATGGSVVDVEARAALNAVLSRLRAHGLIA
jgi:hypothetical protein